MVTTQPNAELVRLDGVEVEREGRMLLTDITLAIRSGELVSVVGPNGGGKTTLLKLIVGALAPTAGTVTRQGGIRIGYQPQRSAIEEHVPMSVDYLLRTAAPHLAKADLLDRLAHFNMPRSTLGRQVADLSGGERQCVLVLRAMLRDPDLLALDEPGTYCDQDNLSEMYARIESYSRETGCATVMVSHDISMVLAHSEHVYCINRRIACEGGPDSVTVPVMAQDLAGLVAAQEAPPVGMAPPDFNFQHRHTPQPHAGHGVYKHTHCSPWSP